VYCVALIQWEKSQACPGPPSKWLISLTLMLLEPAHTYCHRINKYVVSYHRCQKYTQQPRSIDNSYNILVVIIQARYFSAGCTRCTLYKYAQTNTKCFEEMPETMWVSGTEECCCLCNTFKTTGDESTKLGRLSRLIDATAVSCWHWGHWCMWRGISHQQITAQHMSVPLYGIQEHANIGASV